MTRKAKLVTAAPGMNFLMMDGDDCALISPVGCILVDANGDGVGESEDLELVADRLLANMGKKVLYV
jgi:hypothetical protein